MPRISHLKTEYIPAIKVRQAVSMAGFKSISSRMYSHEFRINGCGFNPHSHFYVKGKATAQTVPAVLVIYPFRLDQLRPIIDAVPDAELCKSDSSTAFLKFPRHAADKSYTGFSIVFRHQRAVKALIDSLQKAMKSGLLTGEPEPELNPCMVF